MQSRHQAAPHAAARDESRPELKEVVLGLHWDPPGAGPGEPPTDLDALCVLFDPSGQVLELIHPGHARNGDGSVIHTGDSRTGSSSWDDERIFVFLEALPQAVDTLAFVVASATGRPFEKVAGAFCHVSDRLSDYRWVHANLTGLVGRTVHVPAILRREGAGWRIVQDGQVVQDEVLARVRLLAEAAKGNLVPARSAITPGDR